MAHFFKKVIVAAANLFSPLGVFPRQGARFHVFLRVRRPAGHHLVVCVLSHQGKGSRRRRSGCGAYTRTFPKNKMNAKTLNVNICAVSQLRVSGLELGGLLGSLIAGRISDWYIATSPGGAVGKRIQVVMAYMIGVAVMLLAFKAVPAGTVCVTSI